MTERIKFDDEEKAAKPVKREAPPSVPLTIGHQTLNCASCVSYLNPLQVIEYPNTAVEENTWRRCAVGSTVKHSSTACGHHVAGSTGRIK